MVERRAALILILAGALCLGIGCSSPRIEGPQIEDPPSGFAFDPNCGAARVVLPGAELLSQRCYFKAREPHCSIDISEFGGQTGEARVKAAREALEARHGSLAYGPLESLSIDGRPAWGWLETQASGGKLYSLEYKAVVAYPDRSYSVEFFAADPAWRDEARLRETVSRFAVKRKGEVDWGAVAVVLLLAGLGLLAYRKLEAARGERPPAPPPVRYQGPPLGGRK